MGRYVVSLGLLIGFLVAAASAQELAKSQPPTAGGFRKLAPGTIITIPPAMQKEETYSRHDLVRLLEKDPHFGERRDPGDPNQLLVGNLAQGVRLAHDIDGIQSDEAREAFRAACQRLKLPEPKVWAFEFNFKPMRIKQVDVPRPPAGKFDRKNIWYMVYYVRNVSDKPVKFRPRFLLFTDRKIKLPNGESVPKVYADRLIPVAMEPIRQREDPRRRFLDSVEIAEKEIPPSSEPGQNEIWGVATWEDVDPHTDYFTVYVQGLSNAYKIEVVDEKDEQGNPVRRWSYTRKTLQLNFWRPGDDVDETDREIRYGQPNNVEHRWIYR